MFRKLKRKLLEPSTPLALAAIAMLLKPDFDVEKISMIYDGVNGILAALGLIQSEGAAQRGED